ncbi:unnamed protein product [Closterium sp. NIES-53]
MSHSGYPVFDMSMDAAYSVMYGRDDNCRVALLHAGLRTSSRSQLDHSPVLGCTFWRTAICTDASTRALLATFTREPHSGLFVLHNTSPQVAESGQVTTSPLVAVSTKVAVSGMVTASFSCRSLSHPMVLWHQRLDHPSLPSLHSMASQHLVSGLLRVERYFLVVVDNFSRYTTMFPLTKKSEVTSTLIQWLLATRGSRVRCLQSDRGGEFRSNVLARFCGEQGITQSWTLPESPHQNGVAEHRIGLVMEFARTSMIHARAPHFLWPYAVRYAAHKLNLWPRVSRLGDSPTSLWAGSPGVASEWLPCALDSPDFPFYHLPLHRFLDSLDARFDESVSYYTRYPCRGLPHIPRRSPPHCPLSSLRHFRDRLPWTQVVLELEVLPLEVPSLGVLVRGVLEMEVLVQGVLELEVLALEVLVLGVLELEALVLGVLIQQALALEVLVLRRLELRLFSLLFSAVFSTPQSHSPPPILPHNWTARCPPRARPSSPFDDLRTVLFRSSPCRALHVTVLPPPPTSSLIVSSHPITDYHCAAGPVVSRILASLLTDPRSSPSSVSALTTIVADFAVTRCLDFATRVVAAPPACPPSVGCEFALDYDIVEDRQFEVDFFVVASPSLCAMLLSPEGEPTPLTFQLLARTYVDAVPPPKARYVARGFCQREGVDFFQPFALTPKMTTLRVLLHVAAQRDYELHSLDFSSAFLQGSLREEIWLRRPSGFTSTFPPRTQWSLRRPVYGLCQAPHEWHDTLRTTLAALGFRPSSADPSLFVRSRPTKFFVLVYVDNLVFATPDRAALAEMKSELQKRHMCTDLGELRRYLGLQISRDRAARTITLS